MNGTVPHLVQYQGSKRKLAPQILQYMPSHIVRLVEPFAGMAAISIAVAKEGRADTYYVNDLNEPLVNMLQEAINHPEKLLNDYATVWNEQFEYGDDHAAHFYVVRDRFNAGEKTPSNILYLIARCVKGAVRYGNDGKFNQSPDKRRHGTTPKNLERNVYAISKLLKGKTTFSALDYRDVFKTLKMGDLVYLDPPYQGVTNVRDNRYLSGVPFDEFAEALEVLNEKGIDYIVSYDGECGGKAYGEELPQSLDCKKIMLNAGLSSQAILLGRKSTTYEALYISRTLIPHFTSLPEQAVLFGGAAV
ncbi:MAG: DNA adenine methylase [Clostridiales bacterium]|nr:DNA adenine methylase [Clostridiales bacterium]